MPTSCWQTSDGATERRALDCVSYYSILCCLYWPTQSFRHSRFVILLKSTEIKENDEFGSQVPPGKLGSHTDNSLFIFPSFIIDCGNAFEIMSDNNAWGASGLSNSSPTPYAKNKNNWIIINFSAHNHIEPTLNVSKCAEHRAWAVALLLYVITFGWLVNFGMKLLFSSCMTVLAVITSLAVVRLSPLFAVLDVRTRSRAVLEFAWASTLILAIVILRASVSLTAETRRSFARLRLVIR